MLPFCYLLELELDDVHNMKFVSSYFTILIGACASISVASLTHFLLKLQLASLDLEAFYQGAILLVKQTGFT